MSIVKEYFDIDKKYKLLYGEQIVVLMQVGSFYEIYGVDNEEQKIGNVAELSGILNIVLTKRNKKIESNGYKNPLMIGFPCLALSKYIPILLDKDYTIIVVDQIKNELNDVMREVKKVISPSTYLENTNDEYLILIYAEKTGQKYHIGMSAINVITGKNVVHECHSTENDLEFAIDAACEFLEQYRPRETVICAMKRNQEVLEYMKQGLQSRCVIQKITCQENVQKCTTEVAYQNAVLGNVFTNETMMTNIELISLERWPFAIISYVLLIEYLYLQNTKLVRKMTYPVIYERDKLLVLATNTVEQLDLYVHKKRGNRSESTIKCVYDVINHCVTPGGKRLLKERLMSPLYDEEEITRRLDLTELYGREIGEDKLIDQILSKVGDLERLQRRMSIGVLKPMELAKMCESLEYILELYELLKTQYPSVGELIFCNNEADGINAFIEYIHSVINIDALSKGEIVFCEGRIKTFDRLNAQLEEQQRVIKYVADEIAEEIGDVRIEYLQSIGYQIVTTAQKASKIKATLRKRLRINIGKLCTKITSEKIDNANQIIQSIKQQLRICTDKYYTLVLNKMYKSYNKLLSEVIVQISEFDVIKSNWYAAIKNGYCKPEMKSHSQSYFSAKQLRHPVIEKIRKDIAYIPNDVSVGLEHHGIILYSMNSGGKTSLLKACGLAVIMAQSGSYVPASYFELCPFKTLCTRIISENSVLSGRSSFVAEMHDLRNILKRADEHTLVLADEITHGTEHLSGSAIFTASVQVLASRNVNFVFTTHLHNIYPMISKIENVRVYHLTMNIKDSEIIFEHKLCNGPGESIYGLEVCEALDMDKEFLTKAFYVRDQLNTKTQKLYTLDLKKSRYNKDKYYQMCELCKYSPRMKTDIPLDVHHIHFQCTSDENGMIGTGIHKDHASNLTVLCKECHVKVHNKQINITGYKSTTKGIKLEVVNTDECD